MPPELERLTEETFFEKLNSGLLLECRIALRGCLTSSHNFWASPSGKTIYDWSMVDGEESSWCLDTFKKTLYYEALLKGAMFLEGAQVMRERR